MQCQHYYVTWDERFPYGCRAMQFKSRQLPLLEVRQADGGICLSFAPKVSEAECK